MTLPNFLVIGAQRGGTTLLHECLSRHPQVFLPRARKELHYFDQELERGLDWYEKFFPQDDERRKYRAIGEVTPCYLFRPEVPERIAATLGTIPLIAVLRNPVERAYSQYGLWVRDTNLGMSFDEFLDSNDNVFERGLYAEQLARYLEHWPPERLLILIFERVLADTVTSFRALAHFLGIDPEPLVREQPPGAVNASYRPRFPAMRRAAHGLGRSLRRSGLDWPVNLARRAGAAHWFGNRGPIPPMPASTRYRLYERYADTIDRTEQLLGIELPEWRPA